MDHISDQNGKSNTASAVEQYESSAAQSPIGGQPTHEEIAARAFELWQARGCPEGSAEEDWLEAEEQLRAGITSRNVMHTTAQFAGSVQR